MQIVPVLDLMRGEIVRGVAGRRATYRPVESRLCAGAAPLDVARGLRDVVGLDALYLADLDAIAGGEPAWEVYRELHAAGASLWVDAGLVDAARAEALARFADGGRKLAGVVAGLETVPSAAAVVEMLAVVGVDRLIFSLDLKEGAPLGESAAWRGMSARQIAGEVARLGVRRMIVLDLARVGTGQGVGSETLCAELHEQFPQLEPTVGGGIRHTDDLRRLHEAGCSAALVASALHDGTIGRKEIAEVALSF